MFSIFNRKRRYNDLSWMAVDMHTHVLPGLDDGSTSVADSTAMITRMHQLGIVQFYGTPHVQQDIYPNDNEAILSAYRQLEDVPVLKNIYIDYAAEYTVEQAFLQQISHTADSLLPLAGRYILIGMSYVSESPDIVAVINALTQKGYTPMLANVERYVYYHQDMSPLKKFKDLGCLLQVGLLSCYGYYGSKEKQVVKSLLDQGLIDLLATDIHYERHVKAIEHFVGKQDLSTYFAAKIKNKTLFLANQGIDA
ncbi:tyrosine-protein phosphatase [Sphingobacterium griseoflavum]|uniref:protein-tyrosine-phosphatase n=1 Tax=Sphingobacterium griseoflavum TaxID=1474952 RepID=A0ABQ3HZ97_9SPHI|nr:CpsB/CapC family capsule biosynthesis tyrosine phosphatase [Sphingobacterium griseoflavum]GHE38999.1 capsular polysaccharide biosynthesis protein [Sphingobacterium griseoflavum]